MKKLRTFVCIISKRFKKLPVEQKRPYMDLACDIREDMRVNSYKGYTVEQFFEHVSNRISGHNQRDALRVLKARFSIWLKQQSTVL